MNDDCALATRAPGRRRPGLHVALAIGMALCAAAALLALAVHGETPPDHPVEQLRYFPWQFG